MYDYIVPAGYGDTFYQYAFNAGSLTNGQSYTLRSIFVDNWDFICRHWAGWETVIDTPANGGLVKAYDELRRDWSSLPLAYGSFPQGEVKDPEKRYRVNSEIFFDLAKVLKANNGGTNASQLVFSGVRRIPGWASDPAPSNFTYKPVNFAYPYTLTVQQAPVAPAQYTIQITDYDFVLERIELTPFLAPSRFSMTLYDMNNVARSNVPIDCLRICHSDPAQSNGQLSFFPSPPLLYKVNSAIKFDIISRIGAGGPLTFQMQFVGNRRIPC